MDPSRAEAVLRAGLKGDYAFGPDSVMEVLHHVGAAAAAFVPDVLASIGRRRAFSSEEPHLIHLDPEGKKSVPGLVRLPGHAKETVRYQAVCELRAYGPSALPAVPALTKMANGKKGRRLHFDADAESEGGHGAALFAPR